MKEDMIQHDEGFDILEARILKLESKIFGSFPKNDEYPEVVSTLASLSAKLGNALSTRDRMMMVMKRLDELERYLDPMYGEALELSDNIKLDLVLSREEQLRNQHQNLNTMHLLKDVLDSQHINESVMLNKELLKIANVHGQQEQAAKQQGLQVSTLLEQYNSIITTLTESFINLDEIITKAEIAAVPKNIED